MSDQSARTTRIRADLAEVLTPLDLVLEDVTVMPAGKRRLVRILVDTAPVPDADPAAATPPLDLDQVAEVTRVISDRLDQSDAMGEQPYVLEVSSPGTDRPLTLPRHFRRNVGRLVEVTIPEQAPVTGRIVRADDDGFTVAVTGPKGTSAHHSYRYDDGPRGAVQIEWGRGSDTTGEED